MTNPYQSPSSENVPEHSPHEAMHRRGYVRHVRPVAILMIIQGGMETLMSIFLVCLALFMGIALSDLQQSEPMPNGEELPAAMAGWLLGAIYGTMAVVLALASALHVWAGFRIYQFRSRGLGISALVAGLLSAASCYCLPTAVGLAIYGMIVLLNGPVVEAFQMRTDGQTPEGILLAFDRRI